MGTVSVFQGGKNSGDWLHNMNMLNNWTVHSVVKMVNFMLSMFHHNFKKSNSLQNEIYREDYSGTSKKKLRNTKEDQNKWSDMSMD